MAANCCDFRPPERLRLLRQTMLHPVLRICQEIDIAVGCLRGNELSSNSCRPSTMIRPGNAFASARKRWIEWIFWKDFVGLEMSANYKTAQTSRTPAAGPSLKSTARSDRHPCSACQLKSLPTISRGEDCWSHARAQRKGRVFTFPAFHPGALACDRCQSAGADKVRFRYGAGRAVAHRYPGIDVPRAPCPVRMDREDHRIHSVPKSTKFRGPRDRLSPKSRRSLSTSAQSAFVPRPCAH